MINHLGGHMWMTHVDTGSLGWLISKGATSLLDVGCSVGGQVNAALELGLDAYGIEGDYTLLQEGKLRVPSRILFSDFTKTYVHLPVKFDAVWCVEVAEHIEEEHTDNLLKTLALNLKSCGLLVFTANTGPGIHHVNCKPMGWWESRLQTFGLIKSLEMTNELISASTMAREFIKTTGSVFIHT